MKELLLTLGHNSSAILVESGRVTAGYEEERLSGVKSDSRFPRNAIQMLLGDEKPTSIYCTHWEPTANFSALSGKYWDPEYANGIPVRSHLDNTHHDTHAHAALSFAGTAFPEKDSYVMVVDGFGSYGEHFSVYRLIECNQLQLIFRARGYDTSLGLMYQYATAFMGLKMHEDEYKLLGYEVHVKPAHVDKISKLVTADVQDWLWRASQAFLGSMYDPIFNLAALNMVREAFFNKFSHVLEHLGLSDPTIFEARAALAYYVQSMLENCVLAIKRQFPITNLIVSGGCFYNVKLNRVLIDNIPGWFCAYPLAGDQGNALGLYAMDHPSFIFPSSLCWGARKLESVGEVEGIEYISENQITDRVMHYLKRQGFVNLVRGAMEFGPRALCHTSTLAMPWPEIVDLINIANDRNTVMPMAPVMTRGQYKKLFKNTDRVWKSEKYMITALEYERVPYDMLGAAHHYSYPFRDHYTGRPQVLNNADADPLVGVLEDLGPLINTSFNYHGKPIAFDISSVIENHQLQHARNPDFNTLIVME